MQVISPIQKGVFHFIYSLIESSYGPYKRIKEYKMQKYLNIFFWTVFPGGPILTKKAQVSHLASLFGLKISVVLKRKAIRGMARRENLSGGSDAT